MIKNHYDVKKKSIAENPRYREYFEPLPFNSGYFMCFLLKETEREDIRQIVLE